MPCPPLLPGSHPQPDGMLARLIQGEQGRKEKRPHSQNNEQAIADTAFRIAPAKPCNGLLILCRSSPLQEVRTISASLFARLGRKHDASRRLHRYFTFRPGWPRCHGPDSAMALSRPQNAERCPVRMRLACAMLHGIDRHRRPIEGPVSPAPCSRWDELISLGNQQSFTAGSPRASRGCRYSRRRGRVRSWTRFGLCPLNEMPQGFHG